MCDFTLLNEDEGDVVLVLVFLVLQGEDGGGGWGGWGKPNHLGGETGPGGCHKEDVATIFVCNPKIDLLSSEPVDEFECLWMTEPK